MEDALGLVLRDEGDANLEAVGTLLDLTPQPPQETTQVIKEPKVRRYDAHCFLSVPIATTRKPSLAPLHSDPPKISDLRCAAG
jgi:hypothetical protein